MIESLILFVTFFLGVVTARVFNKKPHNFDDMDIYEIVEYIDCRMMITINSHTLAGFTGVEIAVRSELNDLRDHIMRKYYNSKRKS